MDWLMTLVLVGLGGGVVIALVAGGMMAATRK